MFKKLISLLCPLAEVPGAEVSRVVASGEVERIGSFIAYDGKSEGPAEFRLVLFKGEAEILELASAFAQGWGPYGASFALAIPGDRLDIFGTRQGDKIQVTAIHNPTLNARLAGAQG